MRGRVTLCTVLVAVLGACLGPTLPVVVSPPTTQSISFVAIDARTGAPVAGATVRYQYQDGVIGAQQTDTQGRTTYSIPSGVRDSHVWVVAEGYQLLSQHVDAAPHAVIVLHLASDLPPPPVRRGSLRIVGGGFADDTGPTLPVFCHFGDAFAAYVRTPEAVLAQLDVIVRAGYRGIRFWTVLGGEYWTSKGREVGPDITTDYWAQLHAFLAACHAHGLQNVISQGDVGRIPDRVAFMRRLAETVTAVGPDVAAIVDAGNEAWQTGDPDPWKLAEMVAAFRTVCPQPLLTLTSPQYGWATKEEARADFNQYSIPPADLYDVHGYRGGDGRDKPAWPAKVRHIFSLAYEVKPRLRLGVQSEPTGPGELVSVTENQHELDDHVLAAMAVVSLMARQAWVYMSGHGVSWQGPLEQQPGFWAVPQAVALLPLDLTAWPTLVHGGQLWAGTRVFAAHGETRADQALSADGRFVALIYGPDPVGGELPERPCEVTLDRALGPSVRLVAGYLR